MAFKIRRDGCLTHEAYERARGRKPSSKKNVCRRKTKTRDSQGSHEKKVVKPSQRKEMALEVHDQYDLTISLVCDVFSISQTCYRYQPKLSAENEEIADWLLRLTSTHKRWGFGLCYYYLRNVKDYSWNHKRIYRIYRELELNLRIKPRRRIKRDKPEALSVPIAINQVWSMDFMSDTLKDGRSFRTLDQIIEWRGKPYAIRCDNGPEYISQKLIDWATNNKITLLYIQPGKPAQNAYIERFNRTARHEWLDLHLFKSIEHAQLLATQWLWTYNNDRPHTSIGGVPPKYLLKAA